MTGEWNRRPSVPWDETTARGRRTIGPWRRKNRARWTLPGIRSLAGACRKGLVGSLAAMSGLLTGACELEESSLTDPENILVAEVFVYAGDGADKLFAFLQWTLGTGDQASLGEASIHLEGPRGVQVELRPASRDLCLLEEVQDEVEGACFTAPDLEDGLLQPGDYLEVEISLPQGERLEGGVTLPGDFQFVQPGVKVCALPPATPLEMVWNPSQDSWAYAGETLIWNLRDALEPSGIQVEGDTLNLLGLSISEADTTLVFPQEFGVFDRFDLDRELALALQEGLPLGASAQVAVIALDRNYVNWVRGGSFNPSGAVRIPSLRGDGVGVLAGSLIRTVRVVGAFPDESIPPCLAVPPPGNSSEK